MSVSLGADFLPHERDICDSECDHRQRDDAHELRPDNQQALVERQQAGNGLICLRRRHECRWRSRPNRRIEDGPRGLLKQLVG